VSKTIDQAVEELEGEEELKGIREELEGLTKKRKEEEEEVKRKEIQTMERRKEQEDELRGLRERMEARKEVSTKIACVQFMKELLPQMTHSMTTSFIQSGEWTLPTKQQVESVFLPFVMEEVGKRVDQMNMIKQEVEGIVGEAVRREEERMTQKQDEIKRREEEEQRRREEEEEKKNQQSPFKLRKGMLRLFLTPDVTGMEEDLIVGPLQVEEEDTISDLDERIKDWLAENEIDLPSMTSSEEEEEGGEGGGSGILAMALSGLAGEDESVLGIDLPESGKIQVML